MSQPPPPPPPPPPSTSTSPSISPPTSTPTSTRTSTPPITAAPTEASPPAPHSQSSSAPENSPSSRPSASLTDQIAATIEWWRLAGVDHQFEDESEDWLARNAPGVGQMGSGAPSQTGGGQSASPHAKNSHASGSYAQSRHANAPDSDPSKSIPTNSGPKPVRGGPANAAQNFTRAEVRQIGGEKANWPQSLQEFQTWWLTDKSIDPGGTSPAIAPRGPKTPELMVLVNEAEQADTTDLLSGAQGALLGGFLQSAGLGEDKVYIASALRRHTPMPDWAALKANGLGAVTLHHIGLVNPKRLLIFGRNIPPLLGHDATQLPVNLQNINHDGGSMDALVVESLSELRRSARKKRRFWQHWLQWTDI